MGTNFLEGRMRPTRGADNSDVLAVPNVKGRMKGQLSIILLSLHDDEVKVKVKFTLKQVTKTQRGSRCIALLFL